MLKIWFVREREERASGAKKKEEFCGEEVTRFRPSVSLADNDQAVAKVSNPTPSRVVFFICERPRHANWVLRVFCVVSELSSERFISDTVPYGNDTFSSLATLTRPDTIRVRTGEIPRMSTSFLRMNPKG